MTRKEELKVLDARFGTCGCKDRCMVEQYGEVGRDQKPNGRFSVCETEAMDLGVEVPKKPK